MVINKIRKKIEIKKKLSVDKALIIVMIIIKYELNYMKYVSQSLKNQLFNKKISNDYNLYLNLP